MIILQRRIYRQEVARNKWATYVYGDNDLREGYGGQAAAMRGLPNTIGIRTKKAPGVKPEDYYTDDEFEANKAKIQEDLDTLSSALLAGKLIIMPWDGVGTGRAFLRTKAPKTFAFLNNALVNLVNEYANEDLPKASTFRCINDNTHTVIPLNPDEDTLDDWCSFMSALIRADGS